MDTAWLYRSRSTSLRYTAARANPASPEAPAVAAPESIRMAATRSRMRAVVRPAAGRRQERIAALAIADRRAFPALGRPDWAARARLPQRSEEHTSELQSLR